MLSNITFKHRLIGAIFLLSLAVIIVPALFDTPRVDTVSSAESPEAPLQAAWEELDKIEYTFSELSQAESEVLSSAAAPHIAPETESESLPQPEIAAAAPAPEVVAEASSELMHTSQVELASLTKPTPTSAPAPVPVPAPAPSPKASEPAVVAATEKLIAAEGWAVQLGAFSNKENAKTLAKRLEDKGYEVFLEEITRSKLTRVLVGTKADKQQARELLTDLDNNMQIKGILVKYNPKG